MGRRRSCRLEQSREADDGRLGIWSWSHLLREVCQHRDLPYHLRTGDYSAGQRRPCWDCDRFRMPRLTHDDSNGRGVPRPRSRPVLRHHFHRPSGHSVYAVSLPRHLGHVELRNRVRFKREQEQQHLLPVCVHGFIFGERRDWYASPTNLDLHAERKPVLDAFDNVASHLLAGQRRFLERPPNHF